MAKKKKATMAERHHMSKVASLGCIACQKMGYEDTPCEIHHITGAGMGKRSSHYNVIGLCPVHHRHGKNAIHQSKTSFESDFGTEAGLLEEVNIQLGINQ